MNIGIKGCPGKFRRPDREMLTPSGILLGRTRELLVSSSTQAPVKDEKYLNKLNISVSLEDIFRYISEGPHL